jgi:glycosyltransferase involved in cell wall biosynthesis
VLRQTYEDWELIVSDDESPSGESWRYLERLAENERRIHPVRDPLHHGQVANTNNALKAATGEWIKLLHDDDVLQPNCLEVLVAAVEGLETVAVVSVLATYFRRGLVAKRDRPGKKPREIIRSREVPLAMYLQEAGAGEPTRIMCHRRVIDTGTVFEEVEGLVSGVDSDWSARASVHGDLLLVNQHLVELHDEGDPRVTSSLTQQALDLEYEVLRARQFTLIDPALKPPPLEVIFGMVRLIRAMHRLKIGKLRDAFALFSTVRRLQSWVLALRWAVRQRYPNALCRVARTVPLHAETTGFLDSATPDDRLSDAGSPPDSAMGTWPLDAKQDTGSAED